MVVRKRLDIKGRALSFVTMTVSNWLPVFSQKQIAILATDQLRESLRHFNISLVGYALMPSHLHLLLGFQEISGLSRFVQSFKILTSKRARKLLQTSDDLKLREALAPTTEGNRYQFWKPRFDDLIIYSEELFRAKLNYIYNNPVKAGFVEKPEDWHYSSASDWLMDIPGPLPVDKEFQWL
ncbi:MAG: transposase [candidate division Zixibacteria bacterium]|nr:transposase [candidate division Zixibacteria bacterium]